MAPPGRMLVPLLLAVGLVYGSATASAQVTLGQMDTFEDGTTEGWTANLLGMGSHPAPPANVADGGPGGVGDNYLLLQSFGGGGAGSHLSALNFMGQWAGDYLTAGVRMIGMDVRNFGTTNLFLRIALEDPTIGAPDNIAFSASSVFLPSGSDWTRIAFPLFGPHGLIPALGDVNTALANATMMRIYHSEALNAPNPVFPIEPIVAQLGVDNVTASTVPEPGTTLLFGSGALALLLLRRRRTG